MAKRKRVEAKKDDHDFSESNQPHSSQKHDNEEKMGAKQGKRQKLPSKSNITIQIIVGTYEKILHGIIATISPKTLDKGKPISNADFTETFLFNAHGSAIRCLAISPPSLSSDATNSQKAILASGGSDQSINLYHISTSPAQNNGDSSSGTSLAGKTILENPRNRELGSLQHHSSSVNTLHFPTRSKLLSAAEDNTIAITRTRDWTMLSTIKPPNPKSHGRPTGDTAPFGGSPCGVNDFAVHPSMKLILTVGKGERCMRLWNLVTGKKAGVLNFAKELLQSVGEGKWGAGEGRKVRWNSVGEEFVVSFEKGAVVFGMDSKPKCKILPSPSTKIHQLHYLTLWKENGEEKELLAVSTEGGQILFYNTNLESRTNAAGPIQEDFFPTIQAIGELGSSQGENAGRIKDFEILTLAGNEGPVKHLIIVAGSSNGTIQLWILDPSRFATEVRSFTSDADPSKAAKAPMPEVLPARQLGHLLGTYHTDNRITCLKAFVMSDTTQTEVSDNN